MGNKQPIRYKYFLKYIQYIFFLILFILKSIHLCYAQSLDLNISVTNNINFGNFYPIGAGGHINVANNGILSYIGVVHLGGVISQAVFTVTSNTNNLDISVSVQPQTQLVRVGGSGIMTVNLNQPAPIQFKTNKNRPTFINVGGTLQIESINTNPPGEYIGSFNIIFNRQ